MNRFLSFFGDKFQSQTQLPTADEAAKRADLVVCSATRSWSESEEKQQARLLLQCTKEINKAVARGYYGCQCRSDGSHARALQMKVHFERAGYLVDANAFSDYEYGDNTGLYISWKK